MYAVRSSSKTYISAIHDLVTECIRVDAPRKGVPPRISLPTASRADSIRPETRARTVGHSRVEGHPEHRNVKVRRGLLETARIRQVRERQRARERLVNLGAVFLQPLRCAVRRRIDERDLVVVGVGGDEACEPETRECRQHGGVEQRLSGSSHIQIRAS